MKHTLLTLALLLATLCCAHAQYEFEITWDKKPKLHTVPEAFKKQSAVIVLERRHVYYKTDYQTKTNEVDIYRTTHRIVKVLDDKGIETFNTISIALGDGRVIENIQARTILPDGKVREIAEEQIKRNRDEDGNMQYLIAMEGVEKNAEIELLYTEKRPISYFGREYFQFGYPVLKAEFTLICPVRYQFEFKGYNGFPNVTDTVLDLKHFYHASATNISALEEEKYSAYNASLKRLDYKVGYLTTEDPERRLLTWDDLAAQLYEKYYTLNSKEHKTIASYLSSIGVDPKSEDEVAKITAIEEAIKSSININESLSNEEEYLPFETIIKGKVTTEAGLIRFFTACLTVANVKYELGLCGNRQDAPLDDEFENWLNLQHYLFYFPRQKQMLSPASPYLRYPVVPVSALYEKAVFCRTSGIGEEEVTARAKIRQVEPMDMEQSNSNITTEVTFTGSSLTPQLNMTQELGGYSAIGLREIFVFVPQEKEKELVQGIMGFAEQPEQMKTYDVKYTKFFNYTRGRALKLNATIEAPQLLEKAGNKYLFKVGELIGTQVEMYNEGKRKLEIDMEYPHRLVRTLTINVPEGYTFKNLDALRMKVVNPSGQIGFESDYVANGKTITVNINEYYKDVHLPISEYDNFIQVINAAADFNKVVLILEKQ